MFRKIVRTVVRVLRIVLVKLEIFIRVTVLLIKKEICKSGGNEEDMRRRIALKQSMIDHVDVPACSKMNLDVYETTTSKWSANKNAGPTHMVSRQ